MAAMQGKAEAEHLPIVQREDAWESALQSSGQGDAAAEDWDPELGAWSAESRQEARDKLAALQENLNKAMDELKAKMAAREAMTAEEAAAADKKQLAEWEAHPEHKQTRDAAMKASAELQAVVEGLVAKRKQRLAAKEADVQS
ncbi:unnamed protein product [Prorocentrum cordatum]|uniref:Uncharacterized protein n=1 Tax=Prorocentrum cordatum TaxID=2364126 RepID=A0ABN9X1E1_9DINO|nr:unnamed protein product [Polarella glacialis]